ncbi:MAG: hypothetical protein ACFFCW_35320 [Candidatus Hodarchaeota archaeon]
MSTLLLVDNICIEMIRTVDNPQKIVIKMAETFGDLGIKHSRVTYPAADFKKLDKTVFDREKSR